MQAIWIYASVRQPGRNRLLPVHGVPGTSSLCRDRRGSGHRRAQVSRFDFHINCDAWSSMVRGKRIIIDRTIRQTS